MDGYIARQDVSWGAHDALMGQILVIEDEIRVAILALDLLAVSKDFSDRVKLALKKILGIDESAIILCVSHTHSGPLGLQNWFPIGSEPHLDEELMAAIEARLVKAARAVLRQMQTARLVYAVGEVDGIGGDRNHPGKTLDKKLTVFRFDAVDNDRSLAIIFHYACHPTILGADNLLYSADFPGAARMEIRRHYPDTICMYLNGAAGNISPRYFRRDQSFDEVKRLGGILGSRVVELLTTPVEPLSARLSCLAEQVHIIPRAFLPQAEQVLELTGDIRLDQTRTEGLAIQRHLERKIESTNFPQKIELVFFKIGEWLLVAVPGEPFNELALAVTSRNQHVIIVGFANDYLGYFVTEAAMNASAYEALTSPYNPRTLQNIQDKILEIMSFYELM